MDDYTAWKRYAPTGLLLVGAATCVTTDAATRRAAQSGDEGTRRGWIGEGTVGLVLLGAGLSVFGEAIKRRALHDVRRSAARMDRSISGGRP